MSKLKILPEVEALPILDLPLYIKERAEKIVRETQGESWDDPEDWLIEATQLAHAAYRIMKLEGL